jgi:hypothetical protein
MECEKCKKKLNNGDNAYVLTRVTITVDKNGCEDYEREEDTDIFCGECGAKI